MEGGLKPSQVWKLKKRLCPNSRDPPCAMLDGNGNLLTSEKAIKDKALQVYSDRLKANRMEDSLVNHEEVTN